MCPDIVSLGEILVEIMRRDVDTPHSVNGVYMGPYPSGAPAIFIDAVANLGASTSFMGVIGDDEFGKLLLDDLGRDGVDIERIRVAKGYTTGTAFVMYHSSGTRRFIFHLRHSAAGQLSPEDVEADLVSKCKILHVMGSSLAVSMSSRKACYKAAEIARDSDGIITFDPNLRPELLGIETIRKICKPLIRASRATLPSREETIALTGLRDPVAAARELIGQGPEIAVIKMGAGGALAVTREETVFEPSFEVLEVDPTGAGDVYDAAFAFGLLKGWPLAKKLEYASAAGAIKVTRRGPMSGPSSIREIEEFMKRTSKRPIEWLTR